MTPILILGTFRSLFVNFRRKTHILGSLGLLGPPYVGLSPKIYPIFLVLS